MFKHFSFEDALNDFQINLMKEWFEVFHLKIGLSIQLRFKTQDNRSPTRVWHDNPLADERMKDIINSHCQTVLLDPVNRVKCNNLDYHLKIFIDDNFDRSGTYKNFRCRCHKGISNVVLPYLIDGDLWYIFVGHFLLKPTSTEIDNVFLDEFKLSPVPILPLEGKNYVLQNIFITEDVYEAKFKNGYPDLAYIDIKELTTFITYVRARFSNFIESVLSSHSKKKNYELYKIGITKSFLINEGKSLKQMLSNFSEKKYRKLMILVDLALTKINNELDNDDLEKIANWIREGNVGKFNSRKWERMGNKLFQEEIRDTYR